MKRNIYTILPGKIDDTGMKESKRDEFLGYRNSKTILLKDSKQYVHHFCDEKKYFHNPAPERGMKENKRNEKDSKMCKSKSPCSRHASQMGKRPKKQTPCSLRREDARMEGCKQMQVPGLPIMT